MMNYQAIIISLLTWGAFISAQEEIEDFEVEFATNFVFDLS